MKVEVHRKELIKRPTFGLDCKKTYILSWLRDEIELEFSIRSSDL